MKIAKLLKLIKKDKNREKVALILIMTALFLIPLLFWGKLYIVGGDDTRLYYIYPWEFIKNYVFKITPDNALGSISGYYPKSFWAPFFLVILLLKQIPFLNVQLLMYGLNLSLGFLFFYLFLGQFIRNEKNYIFQIRTIASLFYIFSTYLLKTLYVNQVLGIYLVSTMPCTLYLFLKGIQEKKVFYTVLSVFVFSIFSSTFNTFSWSLALIFVLMPLFLIVFWQEKKVFILFSLIFFALFLLLNLHWISYHLYTSFTSSKSLSSLGYYSSEKFRLSNTALIKAVHGLFNPLNVLFNERSSRIEKNFSILTALKMLFFSIIVMAGVFVKQQEKTIKKYYLVGLFCLLLTFLLFQPDYGPWSLNLFLFLNEKIPFFSMFRNMSDKFSFALAYTFAFSFGISLYILAKKIKKNFIILPIFFLLSLIILVSSREFIFPKYNDDEFSIRVSGKFNDNFDDLIRYIKNIDTSSRFLWIPLTYPGYIYVEDKYNKNHFYIGPSTFSFLTNKSDFGGFLNFGNIFEPNLGDKLLKLINNEEYKEVGEIFQRLNVKYIIENKENIPREIRGYLYPPNVLETQGVKLKKYLFGEKIRDFGTKYSVYKINNRFDTKKIFYTESFNSYPGKLSKIEYKKNSDVNYDFTLEDLKTRKKIILQDLYHPDWYLYINNTKRGEGSRLLKEEGNVPAFNNYASGWIIDPNEIRRRVGNDFFVETPDGGINVSLKFYFFPQKIIYFGYAVSLFSFLILTLYILLEIIKQIKQLIYVKTKL